MAASSIQHPASGKPVMHKGSRGFTLVELSIVLVIIGLIVAGVVAGQSLIKNAQKQALISDINEYKVAINTFKMAYNGLPGDITNAQSYWPTTSNGNGDRIIANGSTSFQNSEMPLAWQQLSLAGLIQGTYTGNGAIVVGGNIPKASLNKGVIAFFSKAFYGRSARTYLSFCAQQLPTFPDRLEGGVITGTDVFKIDQKVDDGTPHSGAILCVKGLNMGFPAGCPHEAVTTATGSFTLTETDNDVIILWNLQ